jgi:hypothetical protein
VHAQAEKLLAFDGDERELAKPDRYLRMLARIPRLEHRVRCLLFKLRFDDAYESAQSDLRQLREATEAAIGCKQLHALLQAVLEVGNELNAGTQKGNAAGFRLNSLVRFCELRSVKDSKVTLVHYVVETLIDNHAEALLDVRTAARTARPLARAHAHDCVLNMAGPRARRTRTRHDRSRAAGAE